MLTTGARLNTLQDVLIDNAFHQQLISTLDPHETHLMHTGAMRKVRSNHVCFEPLSNAIQDIAHLKLAHFGVER